MSPKARIVKLIDRRLPAVLYRRQQTLGAELTEAQKTQHYLIVSMLDNHLYWVMSYSRWQDDDYWPEFKNAFLQTMPELSEDDLNKFKQYNIQKYQYQGIGRYSPEQVYAQGIADLAAISSLLGSQQYMFGDMIHCIDACVYGFLS